MKRQARFIQEQDDVLAFTAKLRIPSKEREEPDEATGATTKWYTNPVFRIEQENPNVRSRSHAWWIFGLGGPYIEFHPKMAILRPACKCFLCKVIFGSFQTGKKSFRSPRVGKAVQVQPSKFNQAE